MKKFLTVLVVIIILVTLGVFISKKSRSSSEKASMGQTKTLLGAGSTFGYPLYSKIFDVYYKKHGIKINYQAIGSGGGIRQLKNHVVDFGASDAFLSDKQLSEMGAPVVHIATCMGSVVIMYNLPGSPKLRFTPGALADIFLGNIKKWNDPRIQKINPGVKLPDMNIIGVHRADGSGTTFIFSNYLSKVSKEWRKKIGYGISLTWPQGSLAGKGSPGVSGIVQETPGSIGYVELIYALQNNIPYALIRNKMGKYVEATLDSTSVAGNVNLPADMRVSITDTSEKSGYPISGFTWILVYKNQDYAGRSKEEAKELVNLLWWIIHQGQKYTKPLYYASLSSAAVKNDEAIIRSINYNGAPLLSK
ncbi:MAG: phosphate ABC transporter substrate-binding protein PstS [Candidatus Omnitrophica bacterium]|nr:phosphate ABC transporter substrate-binding protein PstS [Candidatus Omnitrophota bacterium]